MSIYDPYNDPDQVPTTLDSARPGRSVRGNRSRRRSGSTAHASDVGHTISSSDVSRPADPGATPAPASQSGEVGGQIHNRASGRQDSETPQHQLGQSALLTVLSTIVTLGITVVTPLLLWLIWGNQDICPPGTPSTQCQGIQETIQALGVTAAIGVVSWIVSINGGTRITKARHASGLVLKVLAVSAMAIVIIWLRQSFQIPFPW